jgi:hypothetical protein
MNTNRRMINRLAASVAALALASTLTAQTEMPSAAKVVRIRGSARYSAGSMDGRPLNVGDWVRPGTTIRTSSEKEACVDLALDGSATIWGESGLRTPVTTPADFDPVLSSAQYYHPSAAPNVIRIFANTVLGIDKLSAMETGAGTVTDTELDLKAGHIFAKVKKLSPGSKYEVKIPNGVVGIRGATVEIFSEGLIKVGSGLATMACANGSGTVATEGVGSGNSFDARTGVLSPLSGADLNFTRSIAKDTVFSPSGASRTLICDDHTVTKHMSPHHPHHPHHPHDPDDDDHHDHHDSHDSHD